MSALGVFCALGGQYQCIRAIPALLWNASNALMVSPNALHTRYTGCFSQLLLTSKLGKFRRRSL